MKIGIIGAGQMGRNYTANLVRKLNVPANDVEVHDIVPDKAAALSQEFGIKHSSGIFSGWDAAIVAASTPAHAEVIVRLLKADVRHILCEKPLGLNARHVAKIRAQAGDANIYTALVINFSGALGFLRNKMENDGTDPLELYGTWGKPRPLDKVSRPSAGDVEDEAIHAIAFALNLMRYSVNSVNITGRVGALPFVAPDIQTRAHSLDASFPERPSHSTAALMSFVSWPPEEDALLTPFDLRSSFLLAKQERKVGGIIGKHNFFVGQTHEPTHLFQVEFDVQESGRVVDLVTLVDLVKRETREESFAGDKLRDVTAAFLNAAAGNKPDWRLTDLHEGAMYVDINDALIRSNKRGMTQTVKWNCGN